MQGSSEIVQIKLNNRKTHSPNYYLYINYTNS